MQAFKQLLLILVKLISSKWKHSAFVTFLQWGLLLQLKKKTGLSYLALTFTAQHLLESFIQSNCWTLQPGVAVVLYQQNFAWFSNFIFKTLVAQRLDAGGFITENYPCPIILKIFSSTTCSSSVAFGLRWHNVSSCRCGFSFSSQKQFDFYRSGTHSAVLHFIYETQTPKKPPPQPSLKGSGWEIDELLSEDVSNPTASATALLCKWRPCIIKWESLTWWADDGVSGRSPVIKLPLDDFPLGFMRYLYMCEWTCVRDGVSIAIVDSGQVNHLAVNPWSHSLMEFVLVTLPSVYCMCACVCPLAQSLQGKLR